MYNFKQQIPKKLKEERFNRLMSEQQRISKSINKEFLGKTLDVLVDEKSGNEGVYLGRSQYDAPEADGMVYVNSKKELNMGDFVKVRITDTLEYDLVGNVI